MQNSTQYDAVKNFVEEKVSPGILAHGGEVNIVSLEHNILKLELAGSCGDCSSQAYTSESISNYILEEFPDLEDVIVVDAG